MKAYDLSKLLEELKGKGLDVAEDAAIHVVEAVLDFVEKGAIASENKLDDMLVAILPIVKKYLLEELIDKIDGKDELPAK